MLNENKLEMVKGKNKEQFEKWYSENITFTFVYIGLIKFRELPFEMQIGVYLAYYDSLKVYLMVDVLINDADERRFTCYINECTIESCDSRNEAYKEAFKQADILINKNK